MKLANTYAGIVAALFLVLNLPAPAQQQQDNTQPRSITLVGTPGLFLTWDAETLRAGEAVTGLGYNYFNRDPGRLILRQTSVAFGLGIFNRLEVFGSYDVNKSIDASGILPYRTWFDGRPRPAMTLQGVPQFNNDSPFIDVPHSSGLGDLHFGIVANILSQRRARPFALSFAGFMKKPTGNYMRAMNGGLSNGVDEAGFAVLASRRFGSMATVHLNLGANFVRQPVKDGMILAMLQDSFLYRAGIAFPNSGRIQFISELIGSQYFGDRLQIGLNPKSPIDAIFGFKIYPNELLSLGAGYQAHFNRVGQDLTQGILESGRSGMVLQVMLARGAHKPAKMLIDPEPLRKDGAYPVTAWGINQIPAQNQHFLLGTN